MRNNYILMGLEKGLFNRTELLLGSDALERLSQVKVLMLGVGGVGSWCAESLIRTGIVHLTIVDSDRVCITNINRQLMASMQTVGQVKVDALKERLLQINPNADIRSLQMIYSEETADQFDLDAYDYVVDAIDSKDEQWWTHNFNSHSVESWQGYSFELICFTHLAQIRQCLGIAGISGCGQKELLEAIAGLQKIEEGGTLSISSLSGVLSREEMNLLVNILQKPEVLSSGRRALQDYIVRIREQHELDTGGSELDLNALRDRLRERKGYHP